MLMTSQQAPQISSCQISVESQSFSSSPNPISSISVPNTARLSRLEERFQIASSDSNNAAATTSISVTKRIIPTNVPAFSSSSAASTSLSKKSAPIFPTSNDVASFGNNRVHQPMKEGMTRTTVSNTFESKRSTTTSWTFSQANNLSSVSTLEDVLFPNRLLFFCQFVSHCSNTYGSFLQYLQHSVLQSIKSYTTTNFHMSSSTTTHSAMHSFTMTSTHTSNSSQMMTTASVFYEEYDVFVLSIKKLQSLGRLLGFIQFLPFGLRVVSQTSPDKLGCTGALPFLPSTTTTSMPQLIGSQLPLLSLLDDSMSTGAFLPTTTWIVEYLTLIASISHPYYQQYYCTLYQDVFQRLHTIYKGLSLTEEESRSGNETPPRKIRSEHE